MSAYWPGDSNPMNFQQLAFDSGTNVLTLTPYGNSVVLNSPVTAVSNFGQLTINSLGVGASVDMLDVSSYVQTGHLYRLSAEMSFINTTNNGDNTQVLQLSGYGTGAPGDGCSLGWVNVGTLA